MLLPVPVVVGKVDDEFWVLTLRAVRVAVVRSRPDHVYSCGSRVRATTWSCLRTVFLYLWAFETVEMIIIFGKKISCDDSCGSCKISLDGSTFGLGFTVISPTLSLAGRHHHKLRAPLGTVLYLSTFMSATSPKFSLGR